MNLVYGSAPVMIEAQASLILPTVTVKMGDIGGKIFGREPDPAHTRHYYVTAEDCVWDFAPQGRDVICGNAFPPQARTNRSSMKIR
jgi:hypothetical protein